jgi:8-oxo-dGTP pyrophosphatase MutT (NUDIX family)
MAPAARLAKLLSHIEGCHTANLARDYLPVRADHAIFGYVRPAFAKRLTEIEPPITLADGQVDLPARLLPELNRIAIAAGCRVRHEDFDVRATPDGPVLAILDRGALPDFGVVGVGAHLNGLVETPTGPHLWVARRAANKKLDPGKLDHLVAGGVPAGLTPFQTLLKEAEEEASLPADLTCHARPVARFTYNMERPEGLRRDIIHAYDLQVPASFTPQPADGEVESFLLMPLPEILDILVTTDDFKFNVALVLVDLLIRHGFITGSDAATLRQALDHQP